MNIKEPAIGDIKRGHSGTGNRSEFIYLACEMCGKKRWVRIVASTRKPVGLTEGKICKLCAVRKFGKNKPGCGSSAWQGGRQKTPDGYINIWLDESDFFYPMCNSTHCVREHRLVMAKHLGRCLHDWEVVHHKNGIKDDNKLTNLQLHTNIHHNQLTNLENKIKYLQEENRRLKVELKLK